ncbi:MAG: TonB family protein [Bacteroidales bacterium]
MLTLLLAQSQQFDSIEEAKKYNSSGYEFMMNGNFSEAIYEFSKAIEVDSSNANYYHNRAYCYNEIDSTNLAITDYLRAIKINPDNYEFYYLLGNIYQKHNEIEVDTLYYSKALSKIKSKLNPDTYIILFNRGNCYLKENNLDLALSDYNFSLQLNPNFIATYANRGISKIKMSDTIGACYDWFIAKENKMSEVLEYYNRFCSRYDFLDSVPPSMKPIPDPAFETLEISQIDKTYSADIERMPEFPGGDEARLRFLRDSLEYPIDARLKGIQGRVYVTFVVEKDGSISEVKILKGIGYGCDEEAIRVVKSMPNWIPGIQEGKPVRVQFNMPLLFKLSNKGVPDYNFSKGVKLMKAESYEKAIAKFSKSIKAKGSFYKESYANRGVCKFYTGDYEDSFNDLQHAISIGVELLNEEVVKLYFLIAKEYMNRSLYSRAIELYSEAVKLTPDDPDIYYNRGVAFSHSGDNESACNDWRMAKYLGLESASNIINEKCR